MDVQDPPPELHHDGLGGARSAAGTEALTASRMASRGTIRVTAAKKPTMTMFWTIERPCSSAMRVDETPNARANDVLMTPFARARRDLASLTGG